MMRHVFVTAAGLMQQIKNPVRDEHPTYESCCKSSNGAWFRGKLYRSATAGY
jgi:hypothetical protein